MNEILHANIFFLIASIATIIFCIFICFILYYVLKIVRSIRIIIERIEAGSEMVANDVAHIRALVTGGGIWSRILQYVMGGHSSSKRESARKQSRTRTKENHHNSI